MSGPGSPLVSIVVRSIGRATLSRALDSIAAQDHDRVEAVIVAANAPSHPPIPERHAHVPIVAVDKGEPLRRAEAADAGIRAARGEWITFLDDDDELLPGHVSALIAALPSEPGARAVTGRVLATFFDGSTQVFGRRFSLAEIYAKNYVQLSALLFHRDLLPEVAFDTAIDMHEDWDFVLQLAQKTRFADSPSATARWYADAGASGGGGGANVDDVGFVLARDYVYTKWESVRDPFLDRCAEALRRAFEAAGAGELGVAEERALEILTYSQNDPHALNMLAMLAMRRNDLASALELELRSIEARPDDADLKYNLGLIHERRHDSDSARFAFEEALRLVPDHARASARLRAA
jgi:glycosyltransferase involved in cell wall biosynthesis